MAIAEVMVLGRGEGHGDGQSHWHGQGNGLGMAIAWARGLFFDIVEADLARLQRRLCLRKKSSSNRRLCV